MFILVIILASGLGLYSLLSPPEENLKEALVENPLPDQLVVSSIRISKRTEL